MAFCLVHLCTVYGQNLQVGYCGSQQLLAWYISLYSLWSETQSRVLWQQTGHLCWEPRADKCFPFKSWSRSEHNHTCFTLCPECVPWFLVLFSTFPVHSLLCFCFSNYLSIFLSALVLVNTVSHIGLKNKIDQPAIHYNLLMQILVLHARAICVGSETCEIVYCDSESDVCFWFCKFSHLLWVHTVHIVWGFLSSVRWMKCDKDHHKVSKQNIFLLQWIAQSVLSHPFPCRRVALLEQFSSKNSCANQNCSFWELSSALGTCGKLEFKQDITQCLICKQECFFPQGHNTPKARLFWFDLKQFQLSLKSTCVWGRSFEA